MAAISLVAGPVDMSTPFSGTFLLEDGEALVQAIQSGDWVSGGLAAFSAIADTVAAVMDPFGSLIAAGLGWIMEHLEPLKGWLNDLTGDAGEVAGFAATWANIGASLAASGDNLVSVLGDLDASEGDAIDAYRRFQQETAEHLRAAGSWAEAIGVGMNIAATIVKIVHDLTRDAIAQIVGSVVSYAATLVLTLGAATPLIISQATSRVSSLAARIGKTVTRLLESAKQLTKLIDQLATLFKRFDAAAGRMLPGGRTPNAPGSRTPELPGGRSPDGPDAPGSPGHEPDGPVAPRGDDPPIPDDLRDEIISMDKGTRPDPETYLPPEYIRQHLDQFEDGGTRFMTQSNLDKYGIAQRDGTAFVMPKSEVDELVRQTNGNPRAMEQALGLPEGFFDNGAVRVDIPPTPGDGLRMPSGNEAGANPQWVPGGKLPGGFSEAVIDAGDLGPGDYSTSTIGGPKDAR
ncbi:MULTISPECIES: hypothetical protein [unclassified Leifsonia]|uniref:hypothetical protein n=1 Tax=unclassified Leifsonia TaxID=2663824 RepID=UPI000700588A|nr:MULTISPECIES: hypothetical protein [unclassified Leifsonia]KQX05411.1 hypothetical protein ASC59_14870 [Leifsonia sp. Root1293]KRA09044.1 hypothetical protein ASD61_14865 [Leifsonia sp. Root60]